MALDPYQLCPCGSGKKMRFCCCKDILPELEKVLRAIGGDQRVYALSSINKLIEDKGKRLALLALKADIELSLDQMERADETIDDFLRLAPDNPVALSLSAIYACHQEDLETAVEDLQQALERVGDMVPASVYSAIGFVGRMLLRTGDVLAARGHFILQAVLAGDRSSEPINLLMRINLLREIPLLLKLDFDYAQRPEGVPWGERFDEAMQFARRGAWIAACEALDELEEDTPDQPAILKNIAILSGWVGQKDEAAIAWRKFARLKSTPLEEAVEAEALAQLLDPNKPLEEVDLVLLSYTVRDIERLMELLLSSNRVDQLSFDPSAFADSDQPPPKAIFLLLDKPLADSDQALTLAQVPNVVGELYVYGRQTDREPQLQFSVVRDERFAANQAALEELVSDLVEPGPSETIDSQVSRVAAALTPRTRLPDDTPFETRRALYAEQLRQAFLHRWPDIPWQLLGGLTPRAAAQDPTYRLPLLAWILSMEMADFGQATDFDFNELRRELQLPTREPIDATQVDIESLSPARFNLVEPDKLSDEQLFRAYGRATLKMVPGAVRRFGEEILRRDTMRDTITPDQVYETLARTAPNSGESLVYIERARQATLARNESPAHWLLAELSLRLARGEANEAKELIRTLQARHMHEPNVAAGLYQILVDNGVIRQDGTFAQPVPEEPAALAETAAAPASKLWTPENSAAAPVGETKSKLWIPGAD